MFTDDRLINVENLKKLTKKLLGLVSDHSNVERCNVNMVKSISFNLFYDNSNEQVGHEVKNIVSFILGPMKLNT